MSTYRTAAATAALALFMIASAPVAQMVAPAPAAAQTADQLLADKTPVKQMETKALRERIKALKALLDDGTLSQDQKRDVRAGLKEARAELVARRDASQQAQDSQQNQPTDTQQTKKAQSQPAQTSAALEDRRPASQLSDDELRNRIGAGMRLSKSGSLSSAQKRDVDQMVAEARAEFKKRKSQGKTTQKQTDVPRKSDDTGMTPPNVEDNARHALTDKRPAASLSTVELRDRVNQSRSLLASKQMQPATMKALRAQLAADRQELRRRVAEREDSQKAEASTTTTNQTAVNNQTTLNNANNNVIDNSTTIINNNTTVTQIVQQKTPSEKLNQRDLNRRIRMLRQAERENRLHGHDREIAGRLIIEDRRLLRERLRHDRLRRRQYIEQHRSSFNLAINVVIAPDYDIAAAEADFGQIEQQLVAAPRWRPQRQYTVDEIAHDDRLRRAMPGIEIDTVTFEFGSAELAPEMIGELDNVAAVIEKVTAVRPDEIFLIEGHTDAVGSDQANLALSQARAETVKTTLTDYFAIDPASLRTVGLGERFLKIPTEEPEQENRRVTVRRITPMLTGEVN